MNLDRAAGALRILALASATLTLTLTLALVGAPALAQEMPKKMGGEKQDKREPDKLKREAESETQERGAISGLWGRVLEQVELKGYVEAHYNNPEFGSMKRSDPGRADLHRLVLGVE